MNDERTPILVGTAQFVERNIDPAEATEPLLMLEKSLGMSLKKTCCAVF